MLRYGPIGPFLGNKGGKSSTLTIACSPGTIRANAILLLWMSFARRERGVLTRRTSQQPRGAQRCIPNVYHDQPTTADNTATQSASLGPRAAGLASEELADKMKVKPDHVTEWEQTGKISVARVDNLAAKTYTPLGYLYLPKPPKESLPIRDFRTRGDNPPKRPSPDLLDTVYQMKRRQSWMRDNMIEGGADPLPFVGAYSLTDSYTELLPRCASRSISAMAGSGHTHLDQCPPFSAQPTGCGRYFGCFQRRRRQQHLSHTRPERISGLRPRGRVRAAHLRE